MISFYFVQDHGNSILTCLFVLKAGQVIFTAKSMYQYVLRRKGTHVHVDLPCTLGEERIKELDIEFLGVRLLRSASKNLI